MACFSFKKVVSDKVPLPKLAVSFISPSRNLTAAHGRIGGGLPARLRLGRGELAKTGKKGQSLIESVVVIVLMSFILFGMLQVAMKFHAEQVNQWATFAAARERIVGFNDLVVQKAWLIANIMNSGAMLAPRRGLSSVDQIALESQLIGPFIESPYPAFVLSPKLNYVEWKNMYTPPDPATEEDQYTMVGKQDYPLTIAWLIPMLAGSFGRTNVQLSSTVTLENHFPLYRSVIPE